MLPDIRLIAILRDPVKRAVSAVNHMIRDGLVPPIRSVDDLLGRFVHRLPWRVLEVGHYADQIEEFIDVFGRERLLVFYYEDDVVASPLECLRATCRFLGLDMIYDRERLSLQANSRRRSRLGLLVDYYVPVALTSRSHGA